MDNEVSRIKEISDSKQHKIAFFGAAEGLTFEEWKEVKAIILNPDNNLIPVLTGSGNMFGGVGLVVYRDHHSQDQPERIAFFEESQIPLLFWEIKKPGECDKCVHAEFYRLVNRPENIAKIKKHGMLIPKKAINYDY